MDGLGWGHNRRVRKWRDEGSDWATPDGQSNASLAPGKRSGTANAPAKKPPIWPGKRSLTQHFPPHGEGAEAGEVGKHGTASAIAYAGTQSGGGKLPHLDTIQKSFGRHDVSGVQAHVGGAAGNAAGKLGAEGFAIGNSVGFSSAPDLHTAAHEAAHVVQQRQGVQLLGGIDAGAHDPHEIQADQVADAVVRGESSEHMLDGAKGSGGGAAPTVQRKTVVHGTKSQLKDKATVLAMSISDFFAYVKAQADWFSHPDFKAAADRDLVWKVVKLLGPGFHVTTALGKFKVADVAKADVTKLAKYARCFDTNAETVQLTKAATTLARAQVLGQAIIDLEGFVPTPVLKIVIPAAGLDYLIDKKKLSELKKYYATFSPTLETAEEWDYVTKLLDLGVSTYGALAGWIHDLHVFTQPTLTKLLANIGDTSRSKPVILILFSAVDWNTAFLQGKELEKLILDNRHLSLVVQGMASPSAAAGQVTRVADTYGQQSWTWNPKVSWLPQKSPGRLKQVVVAGHGSEQSVELGSSGKGAYADDQNQRVGYDQADVNSGTDPKKNGTELLFDTVIKRMDPADVNIVFAGCLVNSHDVPATTKLGTNAKTAQKNLQAALAAHPNLADYVRSRIKSAGAKGTVTAANASATFDSFQKDPGTGLATIKNPSEPDLGGTKLAYLKTGIEPEGALRAAIECYADPAIGPTTTTTEIRTKVAGLAASTDWDETITRLGFELCLPASGDVDPNKLLDVVHRIGAWFIMLWDNEANPQYLADNTKPAEAPKVYAAMLGTSSGGDDHIQVGVNEAWMKFDAKKGAAFMSALTASAFIYTTFKKHLARGLVDPKLATLLPATASPTKGQLLLALSIAIQDGKSMPGPARSLLRAAAGGKSTSSFPGALNVPTLIKPESELSILENIGLSPSSAAPSGGGGSSDEHVKANVDANNNTWNETFVRFTPYEATVNVKTVLNVRAKPTTHSTVIDTVTNGTKVRMMGLTTDRKWALIDHGGKVGFLFTKYLT